MCRCKLASATGVLAGRVPVGVAAARGDANRDVADGRMRSERVPQPHTGCCLLSVSKERECVSRCADISLHARGSCA